MWVRSQDGETLTDARRLLVLGNKVVNFVKLDIENDDYDVLGEYESNQQAVKVLDDMHFAIENRKIVVFRMPQVTP